MMIISQLIAFLVQVIPDCLSESFQINTDCPEIHGVAGNKL